MLSDLTIIQHHFPDRPNLKIYPISDVHLGAAEHMRSEWESLVKTIMDDPTARVILGGDLINNATRNSVSNIFEETMRPREQKAAMVEMLRPIRDRILCMVSGNHERRNKDVDDSPAYDIVAKLDIEDLYRENVAFVKIQMGKAEMSGLKNPTYIICVTHGAGGGVLTGGVVNKAERFGYVIDGADALILGHSHKPFITQPAKIKIDPYNNKVALKPFKVISMTSFLSWGGYAAQKMLPPTSYAPQILTLRGNRKELTVTM